MAVTNVLQGSFQVLLVILMVPTIHCLVHPGCHNLTVALQKWSGNGKDHRGDRCDYPWAGKQCDPYFYLCVDIKIPQDGYWENRWSGTRMSSCDYSGGVQRTKEYHNKDSVVFSTGENALRQGLSNPLTYTFITRRWTKARLYVKIEDEDIGGDDPIDEHVINLNGLNLDNTGNKWAFPWNSSVVEHEWVEKESRGSLYGTTASKLTIQYKAVCCQDYYDYDCEVHCVAQNNPNYGFYTCDPLTGDKICRPGYIDPASDPPCVKRFDHCSTFNCQNGGSHDPKPHLQTCDCICPPGTTGHRCQTIIDNECPNPSPCQNGGSCEATDTGFKCLCPGFYTGDRCQYTRCQSSSFTCQNGGVCVEELQGCDCPTPFRGLVCSLCDCSGHGTCDMTAAKCKCNPGWDGDTCNVDICRYKTCLNEGKCIAGQCTCKEGYTGQICEFEIGACDTNTTCLENGTFVAPTADGLCLDSSPCQNGATCNPLKEGYKCECKPLFYGDHCEYELPPTNALKEDPKFVDPAPTEAVERVQDTSAGFPIWAIVIVVIAFLILIIILLVALLWRQKRKRKHAEAQTEHAMRNGGMRNFDNPLYGPNSGAQTQTDANGVAVGTQAGHYDVPKSKKGKGIFTVFGAKNKGIHDTENPYDNIGEGNHYDVPPSSKGAMAPPLPKRSTKREGGQFDNPTYDGSDEQQSKRKDQPPAYLSGAPPYEAEPQSPIKVVPVDYVEPASPEEDEDDPVKLKQKMAATYSKA